ncbi:MAG: hypothetical protein ABJG41_01280 [Cyclobacteriaceae bacterium]
MLKITQNGQALNLFPDTQISFVYENPLFLTDRIPVAKTLSFTIPVTANNQTILGYPNRIHSENWGRVYNDFRVFFGPVQFFYGSGIIQEYTDRISLFLRGVVLPDEIKTKMNDVDLGEEYFGDESEDNFPSYLEADSFGETYRLYFENMLDGSQPEVVAPIKLEGAAWPGLAEQNLSAPKNQGIAATEALYLNFFNANREDHLLFRDLIIPSADPQYHSVCFPSLFVDEFLTQVMGDILEENPFSSGDLQKLCLVNSFHPNFRAGLTIDRFYGMLLDLYGFPGYDGEFSFQLNSFNSSIAINDLLKELLKIFGITMFSKAGKFQLKFNDDIITSSTTSDWTRHLIDSLSFWKEEGQSYAYGYSSDSYDLDADNLTTVETIEDLRDYGSAENIYVSSVNQVFTITDIEKSEEDEPDRVTVEVISSGCEASPDTPADGFDMKSSLEPLKMKLDYYWWDSAIVGDYIEFGEWYVPSMDSDRASRPDMPAIMIYWGLQDTLTDKADESPTVKDQYPYMSANNYDAYGNRLGDLSLQWEGDDGLIANYHAEFKAWIEKEKLKAKGNFLLSALDLKNLDLSEKKNIKGKNFFIEKLEVSITIDEIKPARVHLIEA